MSDRLTYAEMIQRLAELGYTTTTQEWKGRTIWVLEHDRFENATIYLPKRPKDEEVHPSHVGTIRATLKAHGIIEPNGVGLL